MKGVAFKKTFSYAGFEQQPKKFKNPKICLLNVELELKSEKENAEIRLDDPEQYQSIVDAEWTIIYEKLDKITATGAPLFSLGLLLEILRRNTSRTVEFFVLAAFQTRIFDVWPRRAAARFKPRFTI